MRLNARVSSGTLTTLLIVEKNAFEASARFIEQNIGLDTLLFSKRYLIQNYAAIEAASRAGIIVEFGVFDGGSIKRIAKTVWDTEPNKQIYGFDSFNGLQKNWSSVDHYRRLDLGGNLQMTSTQE
jgi:hypothetical protein